MKTGLFFGSFNPVHRGHEAMAHSFRSGTRIDELWIIPTPTPPHKDLSSLAPFAHRWNMLDIVFQDEDDLQLSDVEQQIPPPHYTVKTLSYLKDRHPDRIFFLCIGGDTLQTLSSWYQFEKLSDHAALLVAERPGVSLSIPEQLKDFTIHYCEHEVVDISSTGIRNAIAAGNYPGSDILHPEVCNYIRKHRLYRKRCRPCGKGNVEQIRRHKKC